MNRYQKFMKHIRSKYSDGFFAMRRAERFGHSVARATLGQDVDSPTKAVAIVLFARMFNNFLASKILISRGYGMEAAILVRSILEDFINLGYVTNHKKLSSDKLARRFIAFQNVVPYNYYKKYKDHFDIKLSKKKIEKMKKDLRKFRAEYRDGDLNDWSGRDLRAKAKACGLESIYKTLFKLLSGMTHGGPEAWTKLVSEGKEGISISMAPHEAWLAEPIFAACELLIQAGRIVADVFGLRRIEGHAMRTLKAVRPRLKKLRKDFA